MAQVKCTVPQRYPEKVILIQLAYFETDYVRAVATSIHCAGSRQRLDGSERLKVLAKWASIAFVTTAVLQRQIMFAIG